MNAKLSLSVCYSNYISAPSYLVYVQPWKTNPHMIPTQVAVHVTCRTAVSVTTLICQTSHSSRETTVMLAAAETLSESCLPVKAQLSTPKYQILLGHFRQLSTKWKLRTDGSNREAGTANHITKAVYSFLPCRSISTPSEGVQIAYFFAIRGWNSECLGGIVLLNTKRSSSITRDL